MAALLFPLVLVDIKAIPTDKLSWPSIFARMLLFPMTHPIARGIVFPGFMTHECFIQTGCIGFLRIIVNSSIPDAMFHASKVKQVRIDEGIP
jgi:hypothetical protein